MALIGKVVGMTGAASLILGNGDKRPLNLGDSIQTGDTIQTPRGVEVDLELANGRVIHINAEQLIAFTEDIAAVFVPDGLDNAINLATIDTVIKAIEEGRDINEVLEATAAGEGGQFNAYGFGFVDLVRINDDLNSADYTFDTNTAFTPDSAPTGVINNEPSVPVTTATVTPTATPTVATSITLSSATAGDAVVEGGSITYSITLGAPVQGSPLTVTLSNGDSAVIAVGDSNATIISSVRSDDAYLNGTDTLTVTIQGTSGGNYEQLTPVGSVSNTVVDNSDASTVTLSATPSITEAGGIITYIATLSNASTSGNVVVGLSNGESITILQGQLTGSVNVVVASEDDALVDAHDISAVIDSVVNKGNLEQLDINPAPAVTTVNDTLDERYVNLSVDNTAIDEAGATLTYSVTLTDGTNVVTADADIVVTITTPNGMTHDVTIAANSSSATYSYVVAANDSMPAGDVVTLTASAVIKSTASSYENLAVGTANALTSMTGINDNAVIIGTATASLTESNVAQSTGGTLTVTDVDSSQTLIPQTNVAGNNGYGKFTVGANGVWTYTMDNAHDEFKAGQNYTDSITVTSADGTATQVITVTIAGTNDAAVISGTATGSVTEASGVANGTPGTPTATGTLTSTDIDGTANSFTAVPSGSATYGSYTMTAGGVWTYTLDNNNVTVQALNTTSTPLVDTFTVTAADGTTKAISVTINGANDAAVISGTATGSVAEASGAANATPGTPTATGTLTATDVDNAANSFTTVSTATTSTNGYGTYTVTAGGVWTYTLNNSNAAVQALNVLGTLTDTFTVTSVDGTAKVVTVTINGANDNAVISGTATASLTESNAIRSTGGTLTISDVDSSQTLIAQTNVAGSNGYGKFTVGANGVWTYTMDTAHDEFKAGQNYTDSITVTSTDGTATQVITVTIAGTNDSPVLSAGAILNYTENQVATAIDTSLAITDIDSANITGATVKITANFVSGQDVLGFVNQNGITGSYNNLTGELTLTGSATVVQYQAALRSVTYSNTSDNPSLGIRTISYQVNDGSAANNMSNVGTATINITAVNDAPVVNTGSSTGLEDAAYIPVTLTATDDGSVASFNLSSLPANGALYLDAAMTILATVGTDIAATGNSLTLYFKPQSEFNTTYGATPSFAFTAKDDQGLVSSSATHSITVTAVNDGTPVAVNDSFQTVVGAPITFTRAQLLANDTLFDHAKITAVGPLPAGLTYNAATQTYTYNPAAVGSASFTYTITDDDGQTSSATVNLAAYNAAADLAAVNESALPDGGGGGVRVVTGNLLTNDSGNTSVTSVTGAGAAVGGVFTVTSAYGVLHVTAATGAYTYTLNNRVDNDTQAGADTNGYVDSFTYTGNNTGATLIDVLVNIVDDAPVANDQIVEVAKGTLPNTNLVFVVDISGSMAGEVKSVDSNGVVTIMSRLDAAKLALKGVINEYFSQGGNVSVKLIQFEATATLLNGGNAYATKEDAFLAIDGLTLAGGTNYEDALLKTLTALGTVNTAENNMVYFISDGVPTSGNTVDPAASTGYRNFVNTNGVKSYAIGIASDISNPAELNNIHNVDADVSGAKDAAIIVTDVGRLDEVLLATVPTTFGGSVTGTAGVSSLTLGADGGLITSLIMKLDTNGDNIPDTDVTFNYNGSQISVVGAFPPAGFPLPGDLLTLHAANGFTKGTLIFNFTTGEYSYQTGSMAAAGDTFDIRFIATDLDGDTASGKQTVRVVDGKPEARNDVDTLHGAETFLEGNVITATGTDDGNNLQLTTFNSGRSGEDNPVDNAKVTSIVFKGVTFDLTTVGSGSAAGGTYVIAASGGVNTLTWTATTGGASLIFNAQGYYKYTPPSADIDTTLLQPLEIYDLTTTAGVSAAASAGMILSAIARNSSLEGSATLNTPNADGVGIVGNLNATQIDSLESLVINFNTALHPHGVQDVTIFVDASNSNLGGTSAFNYNIYDIHGDLIGQFASNQEGAVTIPSSYTNIGKIVIDSGGVGTYAGSYGSISSVTYASVAVVGEAIKPSVSVADIVVDESSGAAIFTLTLDKVSPQSVTVNYSTANGTASAGSDYTALSGSVTFAPGETTKTVTVTVLNNTDTVALEDFMLNLNSATNAVIADNQALATIGDDDRSGRTVVLVTKPTVTEGAYAQFNVIFTRALSAATSFTLSTTAVTATAGTDYASLIQYSTNGGTSWSNYTGAISLATNSTGFLVRVQTIDDVVLESPETFKLNVAKSGGSGTTVSAVAGGEATILDNDTPAPVIVNAGVAPEIIIYTLTDSQGDTSTAQLRLNVITDDIAGTSGSNTIVGTARNEYISGLDGNDTISGGAGYDIIKGGAGDDSIDGGADDDQLYGGDGADVISGGTGKDEIYGDAGNDTLSGDAGDDKLYGGAGNDTIAGGDGADVISGGAGSDSLTGGLGADTFKWELADAGVKGAPAADVITDFNNALPASGGDVLDLRDLLSGENHVTGAGNLASYLHFEKVVVGPDTNTVIHVSSQGEFAAGFNPAKEVQTITLLGVDLVGSNTNDQLIIQDMLNKGKLITD